MDEQDETGHDLGFWGDVPAPEGEPAEAIPETPGDPEAEAPVGSIPPISGFWRRLAAFIIDVCLLGVLGQLLGWPLSPVLFGIGPYGRFVGLAIALTYFGVMDSRLFKGQTLGKKVLKVAVRDAQGLPIGVGRSVARTLVWLVPSTLNGWALPIMYVPAVSFITGFVFFAVGGSVLLTMVFNQRSRQGLHDMLTGTYVLATGTGVESLPRASRLQWVLVALACVLTLAVGGIGFVTTSSPDSLFGEMRAVQQAIVKDGRYFSATVVEQTFYDFKGGEPTKTLVIKGWYKGRIDMTQPDTAAMNDLAEIALRLKGIDEYDMVAIQMMSAYDLGLATGYLSIGDSESVDEWRSRVGKR